MRDINLLPDQQGASTIDVQSDKKQAVSPKVIAIVVAALVFAMATYVLPDFYISYLDSNLKEIKKEMTEVKYSDIITIKGKINEYNVIIDSKKQVIKKIESNENSVLELTNSIKQLAPNGLVITSIKYNDGKVILLGNCENPMQFAELTANIERLSIVLPGSASDSQSFDNVNSKVNFNLEFTLGKGGK